MANESNGNEGTEGGAGNGTSTSPENAGAEGKTGTLLLGKYKTQADLEKAHAEQEKILSRKSEEASIYKRELDELRSSLLGADAGSDEGADGNAPAVTKDRKALLEEFATDPESFLASRLNKAIESGVAKQVGQTQEQMRVLMARMAIKEAAAKHSDFGKYQGQMVQISQETGIRDPERLYQMAKYPDAVSAIEQLQNAHKAEIEKLRRQAFAEGGGIATPRMSKEDEALADAIVRAGSHKPNPFI